MPAPTARNRDDRAHQSQNARRISERTHLGYTPAEWVRVGPPLPSIYAFNSAADRCSIVLSAVCEPVREGPPGLAISLNDQSFWLSDLGRLEKALAVAEEAADIFSHLAEAVPDVFLPFLATSLINLAIILSELNRDAEASAIRDEANATIRVLTRPREERVNDQATAQPSDP